MLARTFLVDLLYVPKALAHTVLGNDPYEVRDSVVPLRLDLRPANADQAHDFPDLDVVLSLAALSEKLACHPGMHSNTEVWAPYLHPGWRSSLTLVWRPSQ